MRMEIDLPLLLPYVEKIRQRLLDQAAGVRRIVFTAPGLDAAGLQLIVALQKEFPHVAVELAPEGPGEIFRELLAGEVRPGV
ncbi:hypothetical protein [Pelotomaculum sp. PtaB.Bin117]|uniref:hypothetical protein n=1 Tax=Pelotomaculum sp. PtaB.Bin117 TaxID=1811694 RepID=UPI0009C6B5E1|nr:hypothetical protein [Pelotomaculum sp. PtaB.Bin117]OPX88724.1 MAG: hypothetical protein A4E54_01214 [Pelotomaculum sp. PtaB.Bin117]